jgi:hypothetical protein
MMQRTIVLIATVGLAATALSAQGGPTLRTRWAAAVAPAGVLPEHPSPQLSRATWTNLNGSWDYAITTRSVARPSRWDGKILVPFPVESQLSGVQRAVSPAQLLWYRRSFTAPAIPREGRLLLHFGAVDWQATVWLNGKRLGVHRGGYDPFSFDVTDALRPDSAPQELLIAVWDPTDSGPQPRGKQVLKPHGIWYTAVTGIWQTVWLEPVPATYIDGLVVVPDIDSGTVHVRVSTRGGTPTTRMAATAYADGTPVATGTATDGQDITLRILEAQLWSPDHPFLYDLKVTLSSGDMIHSYFGMRKISVAKDSAGVRRLFLNNTPLFEYGMLDQGWWPDGLYTPPTDDAMRFDIETMKQLGFNLIRKHVKVEPDRWYRLADSLGMLVWQDMPSGDNTTPASKADFAGELQRVVDARRNHPSIVMWVPFNEGWGQHDTEKTVAWLKAHDPSRLVNNASGWTDHQVGDVADIHAYPGPAIPALEPTRAAVLGEFGGLGLPLAGHTWVDSNNWGYRSFPDTRALGTAYRDLMHQLSFMIADGLSAAVYTQTTDVEVEVNGLMTYDREVIKLPPDAVAAAQSLFTSTFTIRTVVPTSLRDGQTWKFTTTAPADGWVATSFPDGLWQQGPGGFGKAGTPGGVIRTPWTTADLWLRRNFELASTDLVDPHWRIHHDEDAEVYLNGQLVGRFTGYTSGYQRIPLEASALAALRKGTNTIAVHVHQTTGGQYFDLGLDEVIRP